MTLNEAVVSSEARLEDGAHNNDFHPATTTVATTTVATTTDYGEILGELCLKIKGASYYSGSSSTWFLRGALAKRQEEIITNLSSSGKEAFSPRGLTDVLLGKLLLDEDNDDPSAKQREDKNKIKTENGDRHETDQYYENYLIVAKALAGDSSKYLPAIVASLSHLVSSTTVSILESSMTTTLSSSEIIEKRRPMAIPREFLQFWISTTVDDSTPETLHHQLSEDLFRVFQQQQKMRDSDDPFALPKHALSCLIQGDSWHSSRQHFTAKIKSLSPPTTQATLRRASVLVRFLSRENGCTALDSERKQKIAANSGVIEWFVEVMKGEGCPARHQRQRRDKSSGLLDLLMNECKMATNPNTSTSSVEWLFSPDLAESVLLFFKETIRELVEDWNALLLASELSKQTKITSKAPPGISQSRTNRDLISGENRKALSLATRYIKFLARLPSRVCPISSLVIAKEASEGCERNGRHLLAAMLHSQEYPLQRLRLVRLLICEFGNSGVTSSVPGEKDNDHMARKEWLSSPGILTALLEECSRDPFLGSSDATDRFVSAYGDPSWKAGFFKKPMLREAPIAITIEAFQASGLDVTRTAPVAMAMTVPRKPFSPLSRWISEAAVRFQSERLPISEGEKEKNYLRVLMRKKIGDRLFGNNTAQGDRYNLFNEEDHASGKAMSKQPQDQYSLFDG